MHKILVSFAALLVLAGIAYAAEYVQIKGSDGTNDLNVKVDSSGNIVLSGGAAADNAASSGAPMWFGGINETTLSTYADQDRVGAHFGTRGSMHVTICGAGQTACGLAVTTQANDTVNGTASIYATSFTMLNDGTNNDLARSVINATDSTGTGIAAAGILAQCDDTTPTAATENQFGNVRRNCTTGALLSEPLPSANAAPALDTCVILSLANTENETNCKAAAANLYGFVATNNSATAMYITFYNTHSATTCGTSEVMTYLIPPVASGGNVTVMLPAPINFTTGMSYCVGTGIDGTTAPSAGTGNVVVVYK